MIDYDKELNEQQHRVVMEAGGPLLVIAGAGSGKTRTLTFRVARLIESGVRPDNILLATFTNKAARSMLARVNQIIAQDINRLWGGTFHHIAHRILRANSHLLGYERNFTIMDSEDARQLMNACISEAAIDPGADKFPRGDILRDIASLAANTESSCEQVVFGRYPFFFHQMEGIQSVISAYHRRKKALNIMDFDDLLLNCRKLLAEHPEVSQAYAGRFEHVLVDEYQDTNIIQADMVDLLASVHRNLMVVGDDSQSIYSFRGAHFANIMKFPEKYPECRIFKLETNYRSTPEILHLANLSIVNNEQQYHKELKAVRSRGVRPILAPARNVLQQADFVCQRILELMRDGVDLHDMAVLYRAHYHSMELQMEMTRRGIPFEIRSGIRFFEQAHIKDVTSFMRIVLNPFDELAWRRILGLYPKVGKVTSEKVWMYISRQDKPLAAVLTEAFPKAAHKSAQPGLQSCQNTFRRILEANSAGNNPAEMIDNIMQSGYRELLRQRFTDSISRLEDLDQFILFADKFGSLEEFINQLALLTNMAEEGDADMDSKTDNRVVLSTIHQAKGLEWSAVFIIWCAEGMLPLQRALKEPDGEAEERRLFYVAATRAKDQLYLCYPVFDYTRGMGNLPLSPSRFIRELSPPAALRAKDRPYEQWTIDEY
ncbi:MAG: ATP-dependent DNA helicase [Deltaproteobacteria bacterium HGW-Deltaproteobacteria-11]|nr:MAG: ATP-dependent DNA helicase [Deltaproteobacteria bacterium HGW-Deltaproteobacteria-11]